MAPTIELTKAELEDRRREILSRLDMTLAEFADVVRTSTLSGEEWEARDQLEEVCFLLGEDFPWSRD